MLKSHHLWSLAPVALFLACASSATAQEAKPAEYDPKQPYELQVVLHFADNPSLTEVFADRLARELRDSLQADFSDLVHVSVVHEHPRLKEVLDKGLATALKAWNERNGVKTQFVLIDFNGVDYEIQTCQHDGITGQPNPVVVVEKDRTPIVRKEKKRDREFVAKAAALLIERDFGLIASFPTWPQGKTKPQQVQLDFKGGTLAALDRWVKKGDVFAVVVVPNGPGASWTIPPDAVVVVQEAPKDGACTGQLFWRYELPAGGNVSYRCVKLGTVSGPLRLRVVKPGPKDALVPVDTTLQIRRTGFTGGKESMLEVHTSSSGLFDSSNPKLKLGPQGVFDQVAFVSVVEGVKGDVRAQVPVPLLTDQPYLIKLSNQPEANTVADLEKLAWKTNVNDSFSALDRVVREILQLATKEGTRAEIIQKGKNGLDRVREDYPKLVAKKEELYKSPSPADDRELKEIDKQLKAIKKRMDDLADFVDKQKDLETKEHDPALLEAKAKKEQAKLLEQDLEYGKAIAIYERLPKELQTKELKDHLVWLHKKWDTNDEKFRVARTFIYDVVPTLKDSAAIQLNLPSMVKAWEECERVNDAIAAQKLLNGIGLLLPRLAKEGESLNPVNVEEKVPLQRLKDVGEALDKLISKLQPYLSQQKPADDK